jgi:RNA polymerase sigma factor (sigma-70 family)
MIFRNYNDFEIVNLIKQGNEEAFKFMVDKYKYFIAKNIKKFNLTKDYDDVFQESLMILYKSIYIFDETYNKSFMRYFELNLTNRLITLKKKVNRYGQFLSEKLPVLCDFSIFEDKRTYITENEIKEALTNLSDFEKVVFNTKVIGKNTIRETAKKLNCSEKKIYNGLDRIKNKVKMHLM